MAEQATRYPEHPTPPTIRQDQAAEALQRLVGDPQSIMLDLSKISAFQLLCTIQLACRHPHFAGPTAEVARVIAKNIQLALEGGGDPVLKQLIQMGWLREYDVPART